MKQGKTHNLDNMIRRIDRFDKYLLYKNISDRTATDQAKLFLGVFTAARRSGKDLSDRTVRKLLDTYPDLSREWLLSGVGDMITKPGNRFSEFETEILKKLDNIEKLLRKISKDKI